MADGLDRVAWGEVAELRWQVATFGFHLASLEVRQHAAVHAAALAALRDGAPLSDGGRRRASRSARSWPRSGRSPRPRHGSAWTPRIATS